MPQAARPLSAGSRIWVGSPQRAISFLRRRATCPGRGREASDVERRVEEIGGTVALLRQYCLWGRAAPFIHASSRLDF